MPGPSPVTTFLFTDIEGSTRLWETEPEAMRAALARHDAIARAAVETNRGRVVKMTGDGTHAAFDDPQDAVRAALQMQLALGEPRSTGSVTLKLRCGVHAGPSERRDNDYFGTAVNRAARIMSAAHGGQVLLSEAVVALAGEHPAGTTLRDLGRVRLRDLTSPERVYQVLDARLRADFPPLRSLEATPNNLPQQLTSFVGRDAELARAHDLLSRTRLLTLLGVGGLGKSRLALQVAAETLDRHPDGVWLVELAAISDERLVPLAVASVLGVREAVGEPLETSLARHVADRQLLVILDNCEHLILACAQIAKLLLQAAAGVRVLATSREALRIPGETTLPMPTLSLPEATTGAADLPRFDAVRLFLDRAQAANPAFELSDRNARAVAEICRSLDGVPLALELAAARVRVLDVERIAARLDDRFRLLTGGDRTALRRQQTLRALIDWSHDLLTSGERVLFRRLAVFAGGWTLDTAANVGAGIDTAADIDTAARGNGFAGGGIVTADVPDLLTRLVEKSLAVADAGGERFHYLESIRQYAGEQLQSSGESEATQQRFVSNFVGLAESVQPHVAGAHPGDWLPKLDAERENLLAAHRLCDRLPLGGELGLRLANALRRYWFERGALGLGYQATVEALSRRDANAPTELRAATLNVAGQLAVFAGHYSDARRHLEECVGIARRLGDRQRIAFALQPLGFACTGMGDRAAARTYLTEALDLAREFGDPREVAAALNSVAQVARLDGDLTTAESLYRDVLDLKCDRPDVPAFARLNLAMVAIARGDPGRARDTLGDVFAGYDASPSEPVAQSALEVTAGLAAACGAWQEATRLFGAAEAHSALTGWHRDPTDEAFLQPLIASVRAALPGETYAALEADGRTLGVGAALAEARQWLSGPAAGGAST
ncbi:MAG: tetratricopeptide repeat protein [Proteobacteria bacterium]|nr:tetratricopeptide repeat protein [Pseudomonadota bacterium]